ncbi:MAG: T9SS type A sorting domain-containing protein [Bacteroidales bacterium]|jgi:aminopeptidase N|nr:T9SS type A sorting domain-containing protein [Bacteroidales bacterium]
MKKWIVIVVFLPLFVHAQQESGAWFCHQKKINNRTKPLDKSNNYKHTFDILHYNLELDIFDCYIEPYPQSFSATNTILLKADSVINFIELNAVNTSFIIDSILPSNFTFIHENDILKINFNSTLNIDDSVSLKIYYRHKDVFDEAFYVAKGRLFTDCEPEGARCWFPCWDKPNDKATIELKAKVPTNVVLGSIGTLQDSIVIQDTLYYHWKSRDPVATYLMSITSSINYKLDIVNWNPHYNPSQIVPIRFYYHEGENVQNIKSKIEDMADFFSALYGPHPFEKNGFATVDTLFNWGGMENQTLTTLCKNCWTDLLTVHEFAHQWFGDMITCATWADVWLNEGFATYSEALWVENTQGYLSYKNHLQYNANYYLNNNPGWAISEEDWAYNTPDMMDLFNYSITYMKASTILHMLRYVVGDELFFQSIKSYALSPDFRYNSAKIPDFFNVVEEVTGENLHWFMEQWIFKPNHPKYIVDFFANYSENNIIVDVEVAQSQSHETFYQMPVELLFRFDNGSDTIIKVWNTENNQMYSFTFESMPVEFVFDPNNEILLKNLTTNVSLGINNKSENIELEVLPLPFDNELVMVVSIASAEKVNLQIVDLMGKIIHQKELSLDSGKNIIKINSNNFPKGVYILNLHNSKYKINRKIIKG